MMSVFKMDETNIPMLAKLMADIKPDWWDYEGAVAQLSDIRNMVVNVGWLMGDDEQHPQGWVLCAEYECYSCLSIECLGYNENGNFVMEQQLKPLLEHAEQHAREKGFRMLKYMIGSTDMSCHGKELGEYWEDLRDLKSFNRKHFDYFVEYGFKPSGFMPNCFGENYHGIIMIKEIK
jgi:hypothetical protein